jgi:hypothetical protein
MLAGTGYGIYAATRCDDCFPGAQVLFVPYGMMAGAVLGAGAGGVTWIISRPFVRRGAADR